MDKLKPKRPAVKQMHYSIFTGETGDLTREKQGRNLHKATGSRVSAILIWEVQMEIFLLISNHGEEVDRGKW